MYLCFDFLELHELKYSYTQSTALSIFTFFEFTKFIVREVGLRCIYLSIYLLFSVFLSIVIKFIAWKFYNFFKSLKCFWPLNWLVFRNSFLLLNFSELKSVIKQSIDNSPKNFSFRSCVILSLWFWFISFLRLVSWLSLLWIKLLCNIFVYFLKNDMTKVY